MKNNNGITLIALTVTIIVLIIIASVGTYAGVSSLQNAIEESKISELNMLQQAIVENYTKYSITKNNMYIRGTKVSYSDMQSLVNEINTQKASTANEVSLKVGDYDTSGTTDITEYYYRLDNTNLSDMGVSQVEDTYIINYKTGEIINETLKVTRTGIPLYTYAVNTTE